MKVILIFGIFLISSLAFSEKPKITVASKIFTESYILAEIAAQVIEDTGEATVVRKFGLGATGIVYEALTHGAIDVYPEYSGTVSEAFLKNPALKNISEIQSLIKNLGLQMTGSLGFNNTYALAVKKEYAQSKNIKSISDLAKYPDAKFGVTHEFLDRADGYKGLASRYGLKPKVVQALQHNLAYEALKSGQIDVTDVYSTDAQIEVMRLKVLDDNLQYFPNYFGVFIVKSDFAKKFPKSWKALKNLEGQMSPDEMIKLNSMVEMDKKSFAQAAEVFLNKSTVSKVPLWWGEVFKRTKEHFILVGISLFFSILVGLPLGVWAFYQRRAGKIVLLVSSIVQTIPSLALLCLLIPLFGVGKIPALVALFLYGLLPVVINTFNGLVIIPRSIVESAEGLGLTGGQILTKILLPIASPGILTGIKVSAVIGIGTATLAALIGAGGYGAPIITGLALNDIPTILQGAIPAAVMALFANILFDVAENKIIPRGLRK